jgi:RND family efflux transporter MFP subunit
VRVVRVMAGDEYLRITSQGTAQPRTQSELIPEVSGRVVWMSPSLVGGGAFQEGEALLRIDEADYRTALQRAQATLKRAEVEFDYAQDELQRVRSLQQRQLASQQQLDNARRGAQVAEANLIESRATLDQARRDLARTEIHAPFDGLVRSERIDVGQFVTRGEVIATIYASDYMEVRLPIAADQMVYSGLPASTQGQIPEALRPPVVIYAYLGDRRIEWTGQLMRLEAEIDERSRMLYGVARVRQDVSATHPIMPVGLFVHADIRGKKVEDVIRLPRSSMRDDNQVLVVDEENRLRFRYVSVLRLEHDDMLIDHGLADGELVCISPLQTVVDGMTVNPILE